jgi:hypothetical protein
MEIAASLLVSVAAFRLVACHPDIPAWGVGMSRPELVEVGLVGPPCGRCDPGRHISSDRVARFQFAGNCKTSGGDRRGDHEAVAHCYLAQSRGESFIWREERDRRAFDGLERGVLLLHHSLKDVAKLQSPNAPFLLRNDLTP